MSGLHTSVAMTNDIDNDILRMKEDRISVKDLVWMFKRKTRIKKGAIC